MMSYGLVFDVDGVLGDTESIISKATIEMFRELYGVEIPPEEFVPFVGTGAVRYTLGPAEKIGLEIDLDKAVARRTEIFVRMLEEGNSISFPGAKDLIQAAADDPQWKLSIATSGPLDKSKATLRAARVPIELFDAYISGDDVTHQKPHPEIYLKAAQAIGLSPTLCVAVEDSVPGVASAKTAGMKVIAVTNSFSADRLTQADLIVDSLEKVSMDTLRALIPKQL